MAKQPVLQTGRYGVDLLSHVLHAGRSVAEMQPWYEDVFGAVAYNGPSYMPAEDRDTVHLLINDYCVQLVSPRMDTTKAIGAFLQQHGQHLYSVGYRVQDPEGLAAHIAANGVRITTTGVPPTTQPPPDMSKIGYYFPHPRDACGSYILVLWPRMVEMFKNPRVTDDWSGLAQRWESHPLGLVKLAYLTIAVRDAAPARRFYTEVMEAAPVHEEVDEERGTRNTYLQFGHSIVDLATPLSDDSDVGRHVAEHGDMIYSVTFEVRDLAAAERYVGSKGIAIKSRTANALYADPENCFGARYGFTVRPVPNSPI